MSSKSQSRTRHDARRPGALAALAAILVGGVMSLSAALSRPGAAMASIPRISWPSAGLARSLFTAQGAQTALANPQAAAPFILHASSPAERQRAAKCLTTAIYYEAALEPDDGQRAVAQVVLNRLRDPNFPKSVCGVVFQGWTQPPGCQFSFTCDGSLARPPMPGYWRRAQGVAEQALNGYVMPEVGTATYYHATYVSPWWRTTVVRIAQVGSHIFYRWPGAAGLRSAFTGRYAGGELNLSEAVLAGRVLAPKIAPGPLNAAQIVVADASAPGGQVARLHLVLGTPALAATTPSRLLPGAYRPAPTPEQVARINEILSRKFPNPPLTAVAAAAAVAAPANTEKAITPVKAAVAPAEPEAKPIATAPAQAQAGDGS